MAPPPLPPLSSVAGSLALSFTSAQPTAPAATPAVAPARPAAPPLAPSPSPSPAASTSAPVVPAPPAPVAAPTPVAAPVQPAVATAPAVPAPVVAPATAAAQADPVVKPRPPLLRPTERRYFFTLFVGGSKALRGGYGSYYGGGGMDFKIEGAIGGHGKRRKTLGGAAVFQVTAGFPFSSFTLAPRLQWDKQIVPEYAIYFTTSVMLGYRLTTYASYGLVEGLSYALHSAVASVGWGVSAIVAERMLLTFRPVNPELQAGGTPFQVNWDVMGGIGVIW